MKRYVIMREADSLLEMERIINEIYQDSENQGFGCKVVNVIRTYDTIATNTYVGHLKTRPCYTALMEISTEGSNQ